MNVQLKTINTSNEALNTQIMARQMYAGYMLHPAKIRKQNKQEWEQIHQHTHVEKF